jgi:hypothetical protein
MMIEKREKRCPEFTNDVISVWKLLLRKAILNKIKVTECISTLNKITYLRITILIIIISGMQETSTVLVL